MRFDHEAQKSDHHDHNTPKSEQYTTAEQVEYLVRHLADLALFHYPAETISAYCEPDAGYPIDLTYAEIPDSIKEHLDMLSPADTSALYVLEFSLLAIPEGDQDTFLIASLALNKETSTFLLSLLYDIYLRDKDVPFIKKVFDIFTFMHEELPAYPDVVFSNPSYPANDSRNPEKKADSLEEAEYDLSTVPKNELTDLTQFVLKMINKLSSKL